MTTARALTALAIASFAAVFACGPKQANVAAAPEAPAAEFFQNGNSVDACGFALEVAATDAVPTARETGIGMGADCDAAFAEASEVAIGAALSSASCDADIIEVRVTRSSFHPVDGVSVEVDAIAGCHG